MSIVTCHLTWNSKFSKGCLQSLNNLSTSGRWQVQYLQELHFVSPWYSSCSSCRLSALIDLCTTILLPLITKPSYSDSSFFTFMYPMAFIGTLLVNSGYLVLMSFMRDYSLLSVSMAILMHPCGYITCHITVHISLCTCMAFWTLGQVSARTRVFPGTYCATGVCIL